MPAAERIRPYNREKAVAYAHKWAFKRNPAYLDFEKFGGDCTNFASQILYAGSGIMNYKPTFGWYYISASNRAPAWTGVEYLRNFLVRSSGAGPFAREVDISQVMPGDIVQLSFSGARFEHSPVVVSMGTNPAPDNILVAAHTHDSDNRPLNTYNYQKARFLHIEGVKY